MEGRYSEEELAAVEDFLYSAYLEASSRIASARPRKPAVHVKKEVERLRKQAAVPRTAQGAVSDDQLDDLAVAVETSYASDLGDVKERELDRLREESQRVVAAPVSERRRIALLVLKNLSATVCGRTSPASLRNITISTASLSLLLRHLGLDPVFAPIAVWFATVLRDAGLPVFCGSVKDYLLSKGVR